MSDLNVSAQLSYKNNNLLCHLDWWEDKYFHLPEEEIIYTIKPEETVLEQLLDFLFYKDKGKERIKRTYQYRIMKDILK